MEHKVIYLKSLFKKFKPKAETFPKDILKELAGLDVDLEASPKPIDPLADKQAGRDFILKHTEEFLNHAVDYSMMDRMKEVWGKPKDLA
jgi:hypothetical protein